MLLAYNHIGDMNSTYLLGLSFNVDSMVNVIASMLKYICPSVGV